MKTFEKGYFVPGRFLKDCRDYDFRQDGDKRPVRHVAYNINDAYFQIMGASLVSVLENNKDMSLIFHIFTDGYSEDNAQKVSELAQQYHCWCRLYTLDMEPFQDFHVKVERFSRITYGRTVMPLLLEDMTERFLYLDADTMVVSSLEPLWQMNLDGYAMGAVSERMPDAKRRGDYLKLKNGRYFNDGVMIVNIPEWQKQHIMEKAFSLQREPKTRFLGQSQDVLNIVFDGSNYFLPSIYNEFGGGEDDTGKGVIIHWTGRRKPWQMVLADFDAQWRTYNKLSPWETITNIKPIAKPENYHDFKQWAKFRKKDSTVDYMKGMAMYAWLKMQYKLFH
jgi:lipopolysaccharide biosynthesis glycosyltransferase